MKACKITRDFGWRQNKEVNLLLCLLKGAATDMRYFARSNFSKSLVYKKNFSLIRRVVFKLGYVFCQEK